MIDLNTHIKKLLSENDIAIIPHFGGFLAHYIPAIRDTQNNLFIPPKRSIGFNEQLKLNDGLLIQSYMKENNIDFQEASMLMKSDIQSIKNTLEENGYIKFKGIGTVFCDSNNQYSFEEEKETTLECPLFFGMKSFEMLELKELQKDKAKQQTTTAPKHSLQDFIGGVAVLSIIIASFFIFSTPVEEAAKVSQENYAKILPLKVWNIQSETNFDDAQQIDLNLNTEQHTTNKENVSNQEANITNTIQDTTDLEEKAIIENKYHIIVASLIPQRKAVQLVEDLQSKGYKSAQIINNEGKRRVSLTSFTTTEDAQKELSTNIRTEFPSAWIFKIK